MTLEDFAKMARLDRWRRRPDLKEDNARPSRARIPSKVARLGSVSPRVSGLIVALQ